MPPVRPPEPRSRREADGDGPRRPEPAEPGREALPALAVASAVGNRAFAAHIAARDGDDPPRPTLARDDKPLVLAPPAPGSPEALADEALASRDASKIAGIPKLGALSEDTRLALIALCNEQGGDLTGSLPLMRLWDSFGPDRLGMMGLHHWDTFAASLAIAPGLDDIASVDALEERFKADVRREALRRLEDGEKLVAAEIARLEPMEQLPLEEQMNETAAIQAAAYQFERAQKAAAALRKVRVRGDQMGKRPDVTRTTMQWFVEPAYFDPNDPPESTTYDDPATDPWVGLPLWQDVKSYNDLLGVAMLKLAEAQPFLHIAAGAGAVHDVAIAPEPGYVLEAALKPLRDNEGAIAMAKYLIEGDEIHPLDMSPVVEAVREGVAIPHSRTPWHGLFYRWVASETIHEHSRDETVDRLLTGAGSFALILLGGVAGGLTGALLMGGGIGLGFYQADKSTERANEMATLEEAKLKMGEGLVAPGTAEAARVTATVDTVIAFLNLLPLAALGRGGAATGAARGGAGAMAGAGDDILDTAARAAPAVADDVAGGAGRAGTAGRAGIAGGRPTAPMTVPDVPPVGGSPAGPGLGPPGAAGGGPASVRPMSVQETKEFFTKALRRPSPLSEQNVELSVDRVTYERAWRNAGGGPRLPPAFTDQTSGRVWVLVGQDDSLLMFHESIHQLSIRTGARPRFVARFGDFLEEGITEGLTRRHLGPQAMRNSYDRHVRFIEMMESRMGVPMQTVERAYIDGELGALEAAIRAGLNGDRDLAASFMMSLRNIGYEVGDAVAFRDALHIMIVKAPPPV